MIGSRLAGNTTAPTSLQGFNRKLVSWDSSLLSIVGRSTIHSMELPRSFVPGGGCIASETDFCAVRFSTDKCFPPSEAMNTEIDMRSPPETGRFATFTSEFGYHSTQA